MRNLNKMTKAELLNEVHSLEQRIAELEAERIEFKQAEAVPLVSEDKFSKTFYASQDAVNIVRLEDGVHIEINSGFTKATGYTREDVVGKTSLEFDIWVNPEDRSRFLDEMRSQGEVANLEAAFRMKDGGEMVGLISASIIELNGQKCVLSITHDISERKQVEAMLYKSEERYRLLAENSPTGIVLHRDGNIFYANQAAIRIVGASDAKDLIGHHILDFVHPDYKPIVMERARSVRDQNQPASSLEEKFLRLDGTSVDVDVTAVPFISQGEQTVQVIINDITERKQTQEIIRLRLSLMEYAATHSLDELLQKALDEVEGLTNSPISFFHFVEADQKTLSLQAWSTRTQNEFCEAQGKGLHYPVEEAGVWVDCVRERRPVIHNNYHSLPHRKGLPEGHAEVIRELVVPVLKDDRIVAILGIGNKPQDYTEKDIELVSYLADVAWEITERKRAEAALLESENKFRVLAERALVGIFMVQDLKFTYVNPAFAAIHGCEVEEIINTSKPIEMIVPEDLEGFYKRVNAQNTGVLHQQFRIKLKTGEIKHLESLGDVVMVQGKPVSIGTSIDVTERMQAEAQLERSLRETRVRLEISQALAGAETEDEVLDTLIQHAGLYSQAFVSIFTFDNSGDELVAILRRQNPFESNLTPVMSIGNGLPASRYTLFSHFVADHPFVSEDVRVDEHFEPAGREILRQTGVTSYAAIPLTAGNEWMGYIAAMAKSHGYFDEEKQHLYQTLAEQGAVALRAARLREIIHESQQRLSLLVQQSPLAVIEWNLDFRVASWNPAAERIFGYTREEALSRQIDLIVPETMRPEVDQLWQTLLAQKGEISGTFENLTKDGRTITCEWFNAPLVRADGQIVGVASLAQDVTERKQAEEALRESEFLLQKSQAVARLGSFYFDFRTGRWTSSSTLDELFGIDENYPKDMDGWVRLVYPEDRDELLQHLRQDVEAHNRSDLEYRIVRKNDQQERWMHGLGELEFDESGNPVKLIATVQDITERKMAEEALHLTRFSVDNVADAIHWVDSEAQIVDVNESAYRMLGYTREEMVGMSVPDIDVELSFTQWPNVWKQTKEMGKLVLETQHRAKDGRLIPVEVMANYIEFGGHELACAVMRDITERKRAERLLQTLNMAALAMQNALTPDQIFTAVSAELRKIGLQCAIFATVEGRLKLTPIYLSYAPQKVKAAEKLTGFKAYEVALPVEPIDAFREVVWEQRTVLIDDVQKPLRQFLPGPLSNLASTVAKKLQVSKTINAPMIVADEVIGLFAVQSSDLSENDVPAVTAFANQLAAAWRQSQLFEQAQKELAARKQAEKKIRQLNEELEERVVERTAQLEVANKELEAFSYSVSHDLRAPLRAIDGFSRILIEDHASQLPDEAIRLLGIVRNNTQQMGRLIDGLLAFSRLSRQPVDKRAVDTTDLVRQALETMQSDLAGREVEIGIGELPTCQGDPTLLKQVWMNLLSNALKFTREQEVARIEIGCDEGKEEQVYFVKDNGVGLDMQYADKLFGVFQRLHRDEKFEGTGVGLAIVQRIVHRHDGRVWVEGVVDQGATFYFALPRERS